MLAASPTHDAIAPLPEAARDAAWRATGRAEVRTYPIGHFDIYRGAPFERAVADQLHFLARHLRMGTHPPSEQRLDPLQPTGAPGDYRG